MRGRAQHNGGRRGRDKAAARAWCCRGIVARPSGINDRVTRASGMGAFEEGEGDLAAGRLGPVGVLSFGAARRQASWARWPAAAAPRWDRTGEGKKEGPGFNLNFS
jgi:hypothetical protein